MATWNTYIWVDDADEAAAKVQAAGGGVVVEPFDVMDSGRMAVLSDPEGAVFCVWQAKNHLGAKVVNEHGALNFNGLATRDPEAAKAFYGAVFGWTTLDLPFGVLWTLPGMATTSKNAARACASRWLRWAPRTDSSTSSRPSPRSPTSDEAPAHWSVTFGVDDVDLAVGQVRQLGGEVVAGPFAAPWTRMAVIKDPQGAMFIASQFVPEN